MEEDSMGGIQLLQPFAMSGRPVTRLVCARTRPSCAAVRTVLGALAAALLLALSSGPASALYVSTVLDTTVNPADYGPSWTSGDPGWENVTSSGTNFIYLGDSWVLSARHVGLSSTTFTVGSETTTFSPIPNQSFVVPNPTGQGLSVETDLRLMRIAGDPGLPDLPISAYLLGSNAPVVAITSGPTRSEDLTYWNSSWQSVSPPGDYTGYTTDTGVPRTKQWGTNRIAGSGTTLPTGYVLTSTRTRIQIEGGDHVVRDIMSLITIFDENGTDFDTDFESQGGATSPTVAGGDSGGGLFYQRGGVWELAGIIDAVIGYDGQSQDKAVFGDATTYVDLSFYKSQIDAIRNAHPDYSIVGDVNLDGQIWNGSGDPAADPDMAAFIAGWGYDNGTGEGDVTSWKHGDMSGPLGQRDGKTDIYDFLLMRSVLNPAASGSLASLLGVDVGVAGVPEPGSALLALVAASFLLIFRRLR